VVTTKIGSEGMFLNTFDNCKSYKGIEPNQRFFKLEEDDEDIRKPKSLDEQISEVRRYYKSYANQSSNVENLQFGGFFDHNSKKKTTKLEINNYFEHFIILGIEEFAESCVKLYTNESIWREKIDMGRNILKKRMSFAINEVIFFRNLGENQAKMFDQRRANTMQALTWSETLRSTQNFAKYVNEKKKVRGDSK
jgi:hypothetical protein